MSLIGVIAGPPAVLLLLVGNPLHLPAPLRTQQVWQAPVSDEVLLWLLAALGWLLWLHLLGSTVVELLRQTRGSTWRMPLPGLLFGANTALASHLIATLLLTAHPTGTAGALLTPARTGVTRTAAARTAHTRWPAPIPTPGPRPAGPDVLTNTAATAPNGATPPTSVQCRVLPPVGRHHDTLWGIAARHLGDGLRWHEIYALNENRLMPDGQRLTRASLIRPGWILHLPSDAAVLPQDQALPWPDADTTALGPAAPTAAAPEGHTSVAPTSSTHRPAAGSFITGGSSATPTRQAPVLGHAPRPLVAHDPSPPKTTATAPRAAGLGTPAGSSDQRRSVESAPATAARTNDSSSTAVISVAMGGLSLAAIAVLAALTRRRKVAARRRPPGTRPATPPVELSRAEAELRRTARAATDVAATVRLALLLASSHAPNTTVNAVWQRPDGSLELVLAEPDGGRPGAAWIGPTQTVPAPFELTSRGWLLPASGLRFLFATSRSKPIGQRLAEELERAVDPFPLLIPVGSQAGSACYVNLETFGLISLLPAETTAGQDRSGDVAISAAARVAGAAADPATDVLAELVLGGLVHALAGAPWAELTQLAVAPRFAELTVGLDRIDVLHPDLLSRLVTDANTYINATMTSGPAGDAADDRGLAGYPSLATARRADPNGAGIIATVVLAGLTPEQAPTALITAATQPTAPVVMLLLGAHPAAHLWRLQPDGTLRIPGIADALQPLRHDPQQHAQHLRLLEHAQDPPHAAPDDAGAAARAANCPPTDLPLIPAPAAPPASGTEQACDPGDPGDRSDWAWPVTATSGRAMVELTDKPESEQGQEAAAPAAGRTVQVAILGPLLITGPDSKNPRPQLNQLLVYLALHRRPVASERLWEAVWPDRPFHGHTLRNRMSDLRGYIGQHVSYQAKAWQLSPAVDCDWARFQGLAAGSHDEQLAALALVRGRPFEDTPNDWIHLEGQHAEIEAAVVDLALGVGQRALDAGDFDTARGAVTAGLLGCPYDERLYQLGMKAAAGRGATGEIRALRRQLEQTLEDELEPDDTLLAGTKQLYRELLDAERTNRP